MVFLLGTKLVGDVQFARAEQKVEATREQLSTVNDLSTVFREVGKAVEPSVVNINVRKVVKGGVTSRFPSMMICSASSSRTASPTPTTTITRTRSHSSRHRSQPPGDDGMEQVGTGSGVVMEVDGKTGYILTNNHVAGGASEMVVTLADGRRIENAKLVGADPKSDLAVVKIEADHLIPAKWGDSGHA